MRKVFALADDAAPPDSRLLNGYPFRRADAGGHGFICDLAERGLRVVLVGKRNGDEVSRRLR